MAKISKILMSFLLIVVTMCFCACSTVRSMTITNDDGTIDELVYVTLDRGKLDNAGYTSTDIEELKARINSTALSKAREIVENFNSRINNDLLVAMDAETKDTLLEFKNGISVVGNTWNDLTYVLGLRFKNSDVYKYYYNITASSTVNSTKEEHFLYTRVYYYGLNMYVDYSELYSSLYAEFSANYPEFIESEESELLYTYVTDLRREHSDADYVSFMDGKYYHTWVVDKENITEPVTLYYNIANSGNCILLCIGVSIVVCLILLIVGIVIDKKKKQKI